VAKSLLPRGFKAEAERIALKFRKYLELEPHAPLCGFELAKHLDITVFQADHFFPTDYNISDLTGSDSGWSALTMKNDQEKTIIIHNHLHAPSRQQSNLMHELAHVICKHEQPTYPKGIRLPFYMREFDKQQEEEATYLGSALQIPREGLIWALKKRMETNDLADHFKASPAMVTLRVNSTGVMRQLSYLF
jgi:Zn-dependent peptidase ImmA (M78 family)